ncbi:multicopper oxidase family protein [Streptomyces triticagri]|uniref:Multicopper oxidase family protein n=1 Tax=Streptomyces triticagri TaxID=2293568 RepID=A0A372LYG4_9ACTN|nr:multicopper oxidase family protein [Streptomyces triticagri]RFU83718.1 multicopper oxidase family protein [Streptomyces triticagri]
MVETLFEQNILWAVSAAVIWGFAARGARRLATRPTAAAIRRRALLGLILLGCALLALALRVGVAVGLSGVAGWLAGADYVLFGALPPALTGIVVVALSVPAYVRVLRAARTATADPPLSTRPDHDGGARPVPRELRVLASRTRLVVPVQSGWVAALLGAACTLHPPTPPYLGMFFLELALLGAVSGALLLLQQSRRAAREARDWLPPSRSRRLVRATALVTGLAVLTVGGCSLAAEQSRLPGRMGESGHTHAYDTGGGASAGNAPARSVDELTGGLKGTPDRRFTLTATERTRRLASGEKVAALAFNGQLPGPELRMRRGESVEVTLINRDVKDGVTLHWHGLDVPNAEDGVAGVTQDAVRPGGRHVYRFRPDRAGTFWYHSHQQSSSTVARGLFGALVVEDPQDSAEPQNSAKPAKARKPAKAGKPEKQEGSALDRTVVAHAWSVGGERPSTDGPPRGGGGALSGVNGAGGTLRTAFGDDTGLQKQQVKAGTPVRLRLVNADNCPRTYSVAGTAFEVAAIDGNDVQEPTELRDRRVRIAGGGRYDITFRQPAGPVRLTVVGDANATAAGQGFEGCAEGDATDSGRATKASLLLAPDPDTAARPPAVTGPVFEPLDYGSPGGSAPFGASPRFDRDFHLVLGNSFGFFDGRPMALWTINNAVYPDIPALLVKQGDLVRTTFVNRSLDNHPMHLHGHRMLVLSKNGKKATGSPWWTDTLDVATGDRYEVAFRADNPGLWMDHCHNLDHARDGMVLHLAYDGVSSPYEAGRSTGNIPE